jgi:hypothetical protein
MRKRVVVVDVSVRVAFVQVAAATRSRYDRAVGGDPLASVRVDAVQTAAATVVRLIMP